MKRKITALIAMTILLSACGKEPAETSDISAETTTPAEIYTLNITSPFVTTDKNAAFTTTVSEEEKSDITTTTAESESPSSTSAVSATTSATTTTTPLETIDAPTEIIIGDSEPQLLDPENGVYYTGGVTINNGAVSGIKNETLKNNINDFITFAENRLLLFKNEFNDNAIPVEINGVLYPPGIGLTYETSVKNGYISIAIGYVMNDMSDMILDEEWYMCETAVFDIVTGEYIEDFSELFPDNFNWEEALRNDLQQVTDVLYKNSNLDIDKILDGGYNFTAEKIIFPYGTFGVADGNELNFDSYWFSYINEGCKSNIPRNYSQFVSQKIEKKALPQSDEYNVIIDGGIYGNRILYSEGLTENEVKEENALYEKIQEELVSEYLTVTTKRKINTYFCTITKSGDFYECYFGNFIDGLYYLYNSEGEKVTLQDLVNESHDSKYEHPLDYYQVADIEKSNSVYYITYYHTQGMDNQYSGYNSAVLYKATDSVSVSEEEMSDLLRKNITYLG